MHLVVLGLLVLLAAVGGPGQTPSAAETAQCGPRLTAYEGYRLRQVTLDSPFSFLHAFEGIVDPLRASLPPSGSLLSAATVAETVGQLDTSIRVAPALVELPFTVTTVHAYIDHCDDEARELDLIFYVFTTRLAAPSSFSLEFGETLRRDPGIAAGLSPRSARLSLEPSLSFNSSDELVAGGRAILVHPASEFSLAAEGAGSTHYTDASLSASGSHNFERPAVWRASYSAGYHFQEQPIEKGSLRQGYAFAWVSAVTRPVQVLGAPIRYALQLEEGFQTSQLSSPAFDADAHYSAAKLLSGVSGGTGPHAYTLNLGFQLGSTAGVTPDWYKLLFDAAHTVRAVPQAAFFDHRSLDLETRITAGWLSPIGNNRAPQNERFFGGVRAHPFVAIPDWDVRSAPVMRGYANNRLHALLTGAPSGREYFVSLNLTAALTTWRLPLLPKEIYTNEDFLKKIDAEKNTARQLLGVYYESRDPAIVDVERVANEVEPIINALKAQIDNLTMPDNLSEALEVCQESIDKALDALNEARASKSKPFGRLLNKTVSGGLPSVIRDCDGNLNETLNNSQIRSAAQRIEQQRALIEDIYQNRVDHAAVERKANEDFLIVDRALTAFIHEINLVSVDPVVVFDMAYMGPTRSTSFFRYSVGGGIRVTLGSTASIMMGYATNPNRGRGEPKGALFLALQLHDLFRW